MTAEQVAWAVLILAAIGIGLALALMTVIALREFGEWLADRIKARTAAASFDATLIAHPVDVAEIERALPDLRDDAAEPSVYQQLVARIRQDQETLAIAAEIEALLEDSRQHIERLRRAGR